MSKESTQTKVEETKVTALPDAKEWTKLVKENNLTTVSSQIRFLNSLNYSRAQIAKHLGKRYQHVRNVLTQPLATKK